MAIVRVGLVIFAWMPIIAACAGSGQSVGFETSVDPGSCTLTLQGAITVTLDAHNSSGQEETAPVYAMFTLASGRVYHYQDTVSVPAHDTIGAVLVSDLRAPRGTFKCAAG
jgi:hypothetical protein